MIGIVGGVGPYAGIDLVRKIFDQTIATCDQDHLPVSMISLPHKIPDRTEFLLGHSNDNPALPISHIILTLYQQGASVIGIPCNTSHAAPIFKEILNRKPKEVKLVHMINEVAVFLKHQYPSVINVGILSTTGTFVSNVYPDCLASHGLLGIQVSEEIQHNHIQPAIYNQNYGIKAKSNPVTEQAKKDLYTGIDFLIGKGAQAIVLGCTEIGLALTDSETCGIPLIDSTKVLARALVQNFSPEKLLEAIQCH